ncbi:type II toxin-antitoxin system HicA family toxin [Candidatus Falkowbacteria bacterium]|nr:type II toxin-antitoxin system HicA family toxin [Candidatus Falkowbacteria bacterium]
MGNFPNLNYQQLIKKLKKLGFYYKKQCKGSHELWVRDLDKATTIVPRHSGNISRTVIKGILKDLTMSVKDFNDI